VIDSGTTADSGTVVDSGSDSGFDSGFDSGPFDSGSDSGPFDSGSDSGFDSGPFDSGSDSGFASGSFDSGSGADGGAGSDPPPIDGIGGDASFACFSVRVAGSGTGPTAASGSSGPSTGDACYEFWERIVSADSISTAILLGGGLRALHAEMFKIYCAPGMLG